MVNRVEVKKISSQNPCFVGMIMDFHKNWGRLLFVEEIKMLVSQQANNINHQFRGLSKNKLSSRDAIVRYSFLDKLNSRLFPLQTSRIKILAFIYLNGVIMSTVL